MDYQGGLIPAVMLSHRLKIPLVKGDIGPDTLIVDDICDSGETLDKFVKKTPNFIFISLSILKQRFYIINHTPHVLNQHFTQKSGIKIFG